MFLPTYRFPSTKFMAQKKRKERLIFLGILIIRNRTNKLEFDIFKKDIYTQRYILNNIQHISQPKMAILSNPTNLINHNMRE